jgi:hypothetical protein
MDSINIVPILTTYVKSQITVITRQIVLWEQKPAIIIAEEKYMRNQREH